MKLDFTKGYTNRSNANRFATKTAKLAKGTFHIDLREGKFYVVREQEPVGEVVLKDGTHQTVSAPVAQPKPAAPKPAKAKKVPAAPKPKRKLPKSSCGKGYKIQKQRPKAHGVVRNSKGTVGDVIWLACDELRTKHGGDVAKVTRAMVVAACTPKGVNPTTAVLRFYLWRRFHGQRGRPNLKKVAKAAAKE